MCYNASMERHGQNITAAAFLKYLRKILLNGGYISVKVTSDLHCHTFLSSCAHSDAKPESYIELAPSRGITTIAFTDHFWDGGVEGASGWYAPQNFGHVSKMRELVPSQPEKVRILYGVETEFIGSRMCNIKGGKAAIRPETAQSFDFVLIPPDHFHMKGFTIPAEVTEPEQARQWFVGNFLEVCDIELGVPIGIAHPFVPMGFPDRAAMLNGITDDDLRRCFSYAAEKGKSVELNRDIVDTPISDMYKRVFTIAREEGASFHFGSDAHTPASFDKFDLLAAFAADCGITEEDIIKL